MFHKGRGLERAKMLLGEGLLTSEDELHLRQRRLAQPAFHRARIAAYAETMATYAARRSEKWRDGERLDVAREMAAYTLAVVGKTLFDADIEGEAHEIGEALGAAIDAFNLSVLPFGELLEKLPIPTRCGSGADASGSTRRSTGSSPSAARRRGSRRPALDAAPRAGQRG
jgi:cytochrome P450